MLNLFGRMAADALSSQSHPPADPLAPPKGKGDPRIDEARRGYRTRCWVWRDSATADAVRGRVWQAVSKSPAQVLISRCGHPHCVRTSHLQSVSPAQQDILAQILQRAGNWPDISASSIALLEMLSRQLDWDYREWTVLLNLTRAQFETGMAAGKSPAAKSAPTVASAAARPAPLTSPPAAATPPPPAMPVLLKKAAPLGNPGNLTARADRESGQAILTWTPAANASVQIIYAGMPGASKTVPLSPALWGSDHAVTLGNLTAGLWHFAIIAGQSPSPDSDQFTWSEPTNWVAIEAP